MNMRSLNIYENFEENTKNDFNKNNAALIKSHVKEIKKDVEKSFKLEQNKIIQDSEKDIFDNTKLVLDPQQHKTKIEKEEIFELKDSKKHANTLQVSDNKEQYSESIVNCDQSISKGKFSAPQIGLKYHDELKYMYYENGKDPKFISKTTDLVYNEETFASGNWAVKNELDINFQCLESQKERNVFGHLHEEPGEIRNEDQKFVSNQKSIINNKCNVCFKEYISTSTFRRHLKSHDGIEYRCSFCSYKSMAQVNLKYHFKTHHLERNKRCDQCGKMYTTKGILNQHILLTHSFIVFPCKKCTFKGKTKGSLRKHSIFTHNKQGQKCKLCDHISYINSDLNEHQRIVHPLEFKRASLKKTKK